MVYMGQMHTELYRLDLIPNELLHAMWTNLNSSQYATGKKTLLLLLRDAKSRKEVVLVPTAIALGVNQDETGQDDSRLNYKESIVSTTVTKASIILYCTSPVA